MNTTKKTYQMTGPVGRGCALVFTRRPQVLDLRDLRLFLLGESEPVVERESGILIGLCDWSRLIPVPDCIYY